MRRRFFVERFSEGHAAVRGDAAFHLARVLRAEPSQLYELTDGAQLWLGRIDRAGRDEVSFSLIEQIPAPVPGLTIGLLLSVVKFDRLEWCLEKASELGAGSIVLVAAARSEKGLIQAAAKRSIRWQKILVESAQQSRRLRPATLSTPVSPEKAFAQAAPGLRVLLSEEAGTPKLSQVVNQPLESRPASVTLAIGPEGGWTGEEFMVAEKSGFLEASLGPRILRTETAVIAALAMIQYALGG
jgi:16S rRNA (uracil1498-N3)-methyltransferase